MEHWQERLRLVMTQAFYENTLTPQQEGRNLQALAQTPAGKLTRFCSAQPAMLAYARSCSAPSEERTA